MATLTLRVDDETRRELEQLARGRGMTVSTLLRGAIDNLLGRDTDSPSPDIAPRSLSTIDRQLLALQHETLKLLSTNEDVITHHEQQIRVLSEGFTTEYHTEFAGLSAEMPASDGELATDILEMFSVLEVAVSALGDDELAELGEHAGRRLSFIGFDFNDSREIRLARLCRHMIDEDRWSSLAHHFDREHERGNSHMRTLDRYQRMLTAYRAILAERTAARGRTSFDTYRFDAEDLKKILEATDY